MMLRLASEIKATNKLVILSFFNGPLRNDLEELGVEVKVLASRNFCSFIVAIIEVIFFLRKRNFDIVQTWMFHADLIFGIISWLLRIPVIWNIRHSDFTSEELNFKWRLILSVHRLCSKFVPKAIVICSLQAKKIFSNRGYSNSKLVFIPNGYHFDSQVIFSEKPKHFRKTGKLVFGLAGRWHSQKHFDGFLKAAALLCAEESGFSIKMCGPNIDYKNLELTKLLKDICVPVELLGVVEDMDSFYESVDFLVMCSRSGEAFPNVVAESMLSGTPTLVTDVGDSLYIQKGNGLLIERKDDVFSISRAMKKAIELSSDDYLELSISGKLSAFERFNIGTVARQYLELYSKIFDKEASCVG